MLPMGSKSRRLLNQSTHSSVANSTATNDRHGPRRDAWEPALSAYHSTFGVAGDSSGLSAAGRGSSQAKLALPAPEEQREAACVTTPAKRTRKPKRAE
jgi:hypothetical protein